MEPSPTHHESFLSRKTRGASLEDRFALVRSSLIPVDKIIDAAQPCLLGFGDLYFVLCILYSVPPTGIHTCLWKERTSLDGWNQDVCKSTGGDKQRSKHTTTTTGGDKHNNHKCWNSPLWIIVGLPSMPPWLITPCTSQKKTSCV